MATKKGTFQDYQGNELRPDLSAQELLDKIKTVDGTGSGLDADLLGGKSADKFAQLGEDGKLPADSLPADLGKDTSTGDSRKAENRRWHRQRIGCRFAGWKACE